MENNNIKGLELTDKLNAVLDYVKSAFVGKDTIVDLMGICLVGRENIFLLGPPGTAKSAIVHVLAKSLKGKTFEYLLTRFTEPNELFGPFDIRKLRDGELVTNTAECHERDP
jgi:MoxR-like ATPase